MPRFSFSSLRVRLLLLVLLTLIPAFGLILSNGLEQRRHARGHALDDASQLVQDVSDNQVRQIEETRQVLIVLAQVPQVRGHDPAGCQTLFMKLLAEYPFYAAFAKVSPDGDILCSAPPLAAPVNVADRPWHRRIIETREFVVGEYQIGRIARKPTLVLAYPVLEAGKLRSIVNVGLDIAWLSRLLAARRLPAGSTLTIIDRNGTILARSPDPERWVGQSLPDAAIVQAILKDHGGSIEVAGVDGIRRLYAFASLGGRQHLGAYVSVGIPTEVVFAEADRTLARNLLLLGLVAGLALLTAWVGGDLLILRQVKSLTGATQRLAAGDLSARTALRDGPGELSQLARSFDQMAAALEQREAERKEAEAEIRRRNRELSALYTIDRAAAQSLNLEEVLTASLTATLEALGVEAGCIYLLEPDGETMAVRVHRGLSEKFVKEVQRIKLGEGISGKAAADRRPVVLDVPDYPTERLAPFIYQERLQTLASTPLLSGGELVGALNLGTYHPRAFPPNELELLATIGQQLGSAVQNARLYEMLQRELGERKRAEAALRESEERFRLMVEGVQDYAIYMLDSEGRIVNWNAGAQRIKGYSPEEIIGQHFCLFYTDEDNARGKPAMVLNIAAQEGRFEDEGWRLCKGGARIWANAVITAVRDRNGKLMGFSKITRDLTERTRAEEALATRTRQLEAVRAVSLEITRELDLRTLLGLIFRRAGELIGAGACTVWFWDEAGQVLVPQVWHSGEAWRGEVRFRLGEGVAGEVAQRREGLLVNDYRNSPYATPAFLERTNVTAVMGEPLLYHDRLLGAITVDNEGTAQPFTEQDREILSLLVTHAAIAIENARLHEATARNLTDLRALYDVGQAVASSWTLDEQLAVLVERLGQVAGAQRVLVGLLDSGDTGRFQMSLAYDASKADPWLRHLNLSPERYPEIQEVVRTGRSLVIPDVSAEPLLLPVREHLDRLNLRSLIIMPLAVRRRVIGALSLGYLGQGRTSTDVETNLQAFAAQAAIAIEKARLYEELRQAAIQLEAKVEDRTRELQAANAQLEEAMREVEAASRNKSEFLANMSHELRTPLNSILGFAQILLEQTKDLLSAKQTRYLGHIYNSGQHLLQLISDILDLSKVEAGKFVLQPEPLPVAATLEDILVIAHGLANKKGQTIETGIAPDLPPVQADPVRFKQILFNLLSNAVKFTPEGGTITLTARQVTEERGPETDALPRPPSPVPCLEIRVTDTGIGIKPEDLPRLFQEFVQLEATATKRHEGTGLGLALTRRLVEMHGGRIWAASDGEGRGSTFAVILPFAGPGT